MKKINWLTTLLAFIGLLISSATFATVPVFQSATTTSTTTVDLVYDIPVIFNTTEGDFISGLSTDLDVSGASITGSTVTLTLGTPVATDYTASNLAIAAGTLQDAGAATDTNAGVAAQSIADGVGPTLGIVFTDPTLIAGETSVVTFTFSEPVGDFANGDITVIENGSLSVVGSSDGGSTYTATFTPTASIEDPTNVLTVDNSQYTDAVGNSGVGTTDSPNYTIETTRPTVGIVFTDPTLSSGETSLVTFTFSKPVGDFANADITVIENGSLSAVSTSDGGSTYTATFTPTPALEDATNVITVDNSQYTDAVGNTGLGTTDSPNYAIDGVAPTVGIAFADAALLAGETSLVTFTFSEPVGDFANGDITVIENGTLSVVGTSDGGNTYTATFTPTTSIEDATNIITVDNTLYTDAAGNAGIGTTDSPNYTIETTRPTVGILFADATLTIGETSLVTFTFSEPVGDFTNADITVVDNGSLSVVSTSDGGNSYTATFTPTAALEDVTNVITVDNTQFTDAAGNTGLGTSDSPNYIIDTARPTVNIVLADPILSFGETSLVTFTFSEPVGDFTNADITVVDNGSLSVVSTSDGGNTYTATFTPTASVEDATNVITVDNTQFSDALGNPGTGTASSPNYEIDGVLPTFVDATFYDVNPVDGIVDEILLEFSENIDESTVDQADFTIGGSPASFTVIAGTSATNGIDIDENDVFVTLGVNLATTDDVAIIYLQNNDATDVADAAGNQALDDGTIATIDLANPFLTDAQIEDTDGDGLIDRVVYVFSEIVSDADDNDTYTVAEVGTITLPDGEVATGFTGGDIAVTDDGTYGYVTINNITGQLIQNTAVALFDASGVNGFWDDDQDQTSIGDGSETLIDAAVPVIINSSVDGSNAFVTVVFSEDLIDTGDGDITVADFDFTINDGGAGVTVSDVVNTEDPALPLLAANLPEDTLVFQLAAADFSAVGASEDIEIAIQTAGNTITDVANNQPDVVTPESTGALAFSDITFSVSISSITAAPDNSYLEIVFSEPVARNNDENANIRLVDSRNDGFIKAGEWTNGTPTQRNEDELLPIYNDGGSGVTIEDDNNQDIYQATSAGAIYGRDDGYISDTFRMYFDPDGSVVHTGFEYYTFTKRSGGGTIRGVTTDGFMSSAYTSPRGYFRDLFEDTFSDAAGALAAAYDVDADGNIDEVVLTFPDSLDDATIAAALGDFSFGGGPPSSLEATPLNGIDPNVANDAIITLRFDSYVGSSVSGPIVFTQGNLRDDGALDYGDDPDGNIILSGSVTVDDEAGPIVLSATTIDFGTDGRLDTLEIEFSESFNEVGTIATTDFTVSGYNILSVEDVTATTVILSIDSVGAGNDFDTYAIPTVSVRGGIVTGQADGAANPDQGLDGPDALTDPGSSFAATDGAAPFGTVDLQNTGNGNATTDASPDLTGTVDDPAANVLVNVSSFTRFATNNGDGTWTFTNSGVAPNGFTLSSLGDYEVTAILIDDVGNTGTDQTNNELTLEGGADISAAMPADICILNEFVSLGQIGIAETQNGDFASGGTLLLTLPEGFEFDTSIPANFSASSLTDLTSVSGTYIGTASLRLDIAYDGVNDGIDDLRIDDLQVKATLDGQTAVGLERTGGTASLLTTDINYAVLTSLASPDAISSIDIDGSPYTEEYAANYRPTTLIPFTYQALSPLFQDGETVSFSSGGEGTVVPGSVTLSSFRIFPTNAANIVNGESAFGSISGANAFVNGNISQSAPVLDPFTLTVNPGPDNAVWLNGAGSPINLTGGGTDPQQTTGTNSELGATFLGVYTYDISVDDGGSCLSAPLRFNVLLYDDIDGTAIPSNSFVDRSFITTQARDTIFVTQPANHTVTVSGVGVSSQFQSVNNGSAERKMYFFDPGLAGVGTFPITYSTLNNITGETVTLQVTFSVTPPVNFFEEITTEEERSICVDDMPLALTVDKSSFVPGQDLQYVYFENYTSGSPYQFNYWYAFNNEFPGYVMGDIDASVYEFGFDFRPTYSGANVNMDWGKFNQAHPIPLGDAYAYRVERGLQNPFVYPTDNIFVYAAPSVFISNVADNYCNDDDSFTIQRIATYVTGFTALDPNSPFTQWQPDRVVNESAEITTGYLLYTESDPVGNPGVFDDLVADFTESTMGADDQVNVFDPSDPDQSGSFTPDEAQNYQIVYTTEPLTGAGCSGTTTFEFTVSPPAPTPLLSATTETAGAVAGFSNNVAPEAGVDPDEYVLEFCAGDVLPSVSAFDINTYNYSPVRTATITFSPGPVFTVGETVVGNIFGAKAIVDAVTPTSIDIVGIVGTFRIGEPIQGLSSLASERVQTYVENSLEEENIVGATSLATGTITDLGDDRFILTVNSGAFLDGEEFVGQSTNARGQIESLAEISWYLEADAAPIAGLENRYSVSPQNLGINVGTGFRLTEQTVDFYMSTTSVFGCESDLRKVTINVFDIPDIPVIDISAWPASVQNGITYAFDYCVENDGTSVVPDDILLADLIEDERYNVSGIFIDADAPNSFINASITDPGVGTDQETQSVPPIFAGDTIILSITKTENINLDAFSSFDGCEGSQILVRIVGHEEVSTVSNFDFNANTTDFYICEGDPLPNITHTFVDGTDEYYWYENVDGSDNGVNQIGSDLRSGDPMTAILLATASGNPFDNNTPGTYTYYVARNNDVIDNRDFVGCESEAVAVNINVLEQQPAPTVISNNSLNASISDFPNLDPDADDNYEFAICSDQLVSNLTLQATNLYSGDERVEWYNQVSGQRVAIGEQPNFSELQLLGQDVGVVTFEVIQVTDTLTDAFGNYFDGCASLVATVDIIISEPDVLILRDKVLEGTIANAYCRDADPLGNGGTIPLDLWRDVNGGEALDTVSNSTLTYDIDSYVGFVGNGTPVSESGSNNPILDIDVLHDAVGGVAVGGPSTAHRITYTYADPSFCVSTFIKDIIINPDPDISISFNGVNADGEEFCYDDPDIVVTGLVNNGSGTFVAANAGTFTLNGNPLSATNGIAAVDPSAANVHGTDPFAAQSSHTIAYTYSDGNNCERTISRTIFVNPRPEIVTGRIQATNTCETGSLELFVEMSEPLANYRFEWRFAGQDILEIEDEDGDSTDAFLTYALVGSSGNFGVTAINLTTGCEADVNLQSITVGEAPEPTVAWVGTTVGFTTDFRVFQDNTALDDENVDSLGIRIDGVLVVNEEDPLQINFPYEYATVFSTVSSPTNPHTIEVGMRTTAGCRIQMTEREITIIDYITPTNSFYNEDFEIDAGGWTLEERSLDGKSDNLPTSWEIGSNIPDEYSEAGGVPSGSRAAYTNGYLSEEQSFIYSPAFNLVSFDAPTISFLRHEDFQTFRDGAVLQYSVDDGRTWSNVGGFDSSEEQEELQSTPGWYNTEAITGDPGNISISPDEVDLSVGENPDGFGWAEQSDWREAIAPLDIPDGTASFVRLRFAFGAQEGFKEDFKGFAFDNVEIYDRQQVVLLEQYSSTWDQLSKDANHAVKNSGTYQSPDIIKINYFTDFRNEGASRDQIHLRNSEGPGARSSFYGISDVPSLAIAGTPLLVESTDELEQSIRAQLINTKLNDPGFEITFTTASISDNTLTVAADFLTISEVDARLGLFFAVLEPQVVLDASSAPKGLYVEDDTIENVFRKMLPNPAGQFEDGLFPVSTTIAAGPYTWPITNMYNQDTLTVVAFVQDLDSKLVYQSAVIGLNNAGLALSADIPVELSMYPNPADKQVTIDFSEPIQEETAWIVYDQAGREVLKGFASKGTIELTVETKNVPSGMYVLQLVAEDRRQALRLMIRH